MHSLALFLNIRFLRSFRFLKYQHKNIIYKYIILAYKCLSPLSFQSVFYPPEAAPPLLSFSYFLYSNSVELNENPHAKINFPEKYTRDIKVIAGFKTFPRNFFLFRPNSNSNILKSPKNVGVGGGGSLIQHQSTFRINQSHHTNIFLKLLAF